MSHSATGLHRLAEAGLSFLADMLIASGHLPKAFIIRLSSSDVAGSDPMGNLVSSFNPILTIALFYIVITSNGTP